MNLLWRTAKKRQMGIFVDQVLHSFQCNAVFDYKTDEKLCTSCNTPSKDFFEAFKSELCCLKDFKLEVEFKSDAQPIFCKKTSSQGHSRKPGESIRRRYRQKYMGMHSIQWIQQSSCSCQEHSYQDRRNPKITLYGKYSAALDSQLKDHRHPLPLLEDLISRLGRMWM